MNTVTAKSGLPIRLTDERWQHIITEHAELSELQEQVLNTLTEPDRILEGNHSERIAVKEYVTGKWMLVVYRELEADGFIITAFFTKRERSFAKRKVLWSRST